MSVHAFFVKPLGRSKRLLRRYASPSDTKPRCPGPISYHNAEVVMDVVFDPVRADRRVLSRASGDLWPHDDARWPVKCDSCDYVFRADDEWQLMHEPIYVDDAGAEYTLRKPVPGMMWDAYWMGEAYQGADGRCLVVITPDGREWMIDGPARNCTEPGDRGAYGVAHRCWCRSGEPPAITVGKSPGRTCGAGGGSIDTGTYHGFLVGGVFNP